MKHGTKVVLATVLAVALMGGCAATPSAMGGGSGQYRTAAPTVKPWAENARLGRARAGLDRGDALSMFSGFAMASDGMGMRAERTVQVARAAKLRANPMKSPVRVEYATVPTNPTIQP